MHQVRLINKFTYLLIGLNISFSCLSNAAESKTTLTREDNVAIHEVVLKARKAIVSENPSELLKYISVEKGLTCTDTDYTFSDINKFISNKKSYLYISLYSTEKYLAECGADNYPKEFPPISEKEYFKSANDLISIELLEKDWVSISFTSNVKSHYPREWVLHKEKGSWKISGGSFIIGNCTCG